MKAVRPITISNGGLLPPNGVSRLAKHVRNGEGRRERREISRIRVLTTHHHKLTG